MSKVTMLSLSCPQFTQENSVGIVDHSLDQVVRQPGLPGGVEENLPGDVIKLRVVDADKSPGLLDEALAHINTGVRDDARELVEGITEVLQVHSPLWF